MNNISKRRGGKKRTGASGSPAQPKLCNASLNMSLVQTQASLMFFNRNIWWNPMIGSSSALSCPTTILSIQLSGVGWWSCAVMLCCIFWKGRLESFSTIAERAAAAEGSSRSLGSLGEPWLVPGLGDPAACGCVRGVLCWCGAASRCCGSERAGTV